MSNRLSGESPLEMLEVSFRLLSEGPRPLELDTSTYPGLPARTVPLSELRSMLLHPSTSYATRDAVLGELIRRARAENAWLIGLAGVLLPGLRTAVFPLCRCCPGRSEDIESELIAGFLEALASIDPAGQRLAARLTWAARKRAERLLQRELAEQGRPAHQSISAEPPRPWGHPDFVLARAVETGVISAEDAALIGTTRLEDVSLEQAARALGISYSAARNRRVRAERMLVEAIGSGFATKAPVHPDSPRRGRPRQERRNDRSATRPSELDQRR